MRCVRKAFPKAEIHFATKEVFKDLVKHNPYIDQLRLLGDEWDAYLSTFRGEAFDIYIDLHKNIRTKLIKRVLDLGSYISYDKRNWAKWQLVHLKRNTLQSYSVHDSYFEALAPLGVTYDGQGLDVFLGEEGQGLELPDQAYIAMVIGAQFATKQAPKEKLAALLQKVEKPVVLIGGKGERELADFLTSHHDKVSNWVGKASLLESAFLLKGAHKVLSHDTGMMHIAASLNKDMAVLWGSSLKEFGFYPVYRENSKASVMHFAQNGLSCRPCSKLGKSACPKGHFKCMNDHYYDRLAEYLNR